MLTKYEIEEENEPINVTVNKDGSLSYVVMDTPMYWHPTGRTISEIQQELIDRNIPF